jgi:type II secretory pathway pseudopilin PulG
MSEPGNGNPTTRQKSFTIVQLLIVTAVIGVVLIPTAIWGSEGIPGSCVLGVTSFAMWAKRFGIFFTLIGAALLILVLADLLAMNHHHGAARRTVCQNNLRQLVLAMHNYQSAYGKLPPPYTVDANGKPLHSWRVLLLPFLDEGDLYNAIDLSKPWDDPVNLQFAPQMPDVFKCPNFKPVRNDKIPEAMTSYVAVVGKETIWNPTAGGLSFDNVTDGSSNTIMILESVANRVNWMSPQDLDFNKIVDDPQTGACDLPDSDHPGGGQVALIDGSVRFITADNTAESIKAAITVAGGEESNALDR